MYSFSHSFKLYWVSLLCQPLFYVLRSHHNCHYPPKWSSLNVRCHCRASPNVHSPNPHNNPMRCVLWLPSVYGWGNFSQVILHCWDSLKLLHPFSMSHLDSDSFFINPSLPKLFNLLSHSSLTGNLWVLRSDSSLPSSSSSHYLPQPGVLGW